MRHTVRGGRWKPFTSKYGIPIGWVYSSACNTKHVATGVSGHLPKLYIAYLPMGKICVRHVQNMVVQMCKRVEQISSNVHV